VNSFPDPTSFIVFVLFWTGSFLIVEQAPSFSGFDSSGFFFWVFVKDVVYREKVQKCE
jgi:hypothetical protein